MVKPPNFQVASTCCPCLRQFLLQNHPLWGEAFCCPRSTDGFPMWMQNTPRLRLVGIFGQSKLNGSVVGGEKTNPPFQKMRSSKLDHESPRLRGEVKLPKKCLEVSPVMEISTFLEQPETGQAQCCTHHLSGLPWPQTSIRHGSAPSKWCIFNPKFDHMICQTTSWTVDSPPPKKNNFSVLNSSILDNLHIWRIYLADFLHPPGMFVTRECLQPSQSLEKIWHSWHHQVVQNSEHIHSLNLTVRPWK